MYPSTATFAKYGIASSRRAAKIMRINDITIKSL